MHCTKALHQYDIIAHTQNETDYSYLANLWQRLTKYFLAEDIVSLSSGIVFLMYAAMVDTYWLESPTESTFCHGIWEWDIEHMVKIK